MLHAFPPARRSHGVALLSAVGAAAAGLGPSLGGLLVAAANWRLVFLVNIPIGVAAVLLARRRLVESRAPGRRRIPDLPGTLLFAVAIATLVLGVVKGQEWGWGSARIIGCLAVALALGAVVVWRCTPAPLAGHRPVPAEDPDVQRRQRDDGHRGGRLLRLHARERLVPHRRMAILGPAGWPGAHRRPGRRGGRGRPTSRLAQRIGPRPVLVAGGLIWGGAVLWFVARVGTTPDFLGRWLPGMVLLGIGAGTLFPNLSGTAVASAPGESFATATGMNSVARQVGAALGVAVVVAIIGTPTSAAAYAVFHHAWTFGAVCLFAAGLGCLLVGRVKADQAAGARERCARRCCPGGCASGSRGDGARGALRSPRPRPRRVIALDTGDPAVPRAESAAEFLARTPLFSGIDPELVGQLAAKSRTRRLAAGKWLFRERDPGDEMYVVRAGRLEVVDEGAGAVIRELRRGDALGELALLTDSPRSASVRAARATEVIAVDQADFSELLHRSPALSLALNRSLSRRLQDARAPASTTRPRPATVALVALDGADPAAAARHPAGRRPAGSPVGRSARRCATYRAQQCRVTQPPCTDRCSTGPRQATTWSCSSAGPPCTSPGRSSASSMPTGSWR